MLGATIANWRQRHEDAAGAFEQALRHARLAGEQRADLLAAEAWALVHGPRPAGEALRRIDAIVAEHPTPLSLVRRAMLLAMLGRFDEARTIGIEASAQAREFGLSLELQLAWMAMLAGDHETAVKHLRRGCDEAEEKGNRGGQSFHALVLGRVLCSLGQYDEAERLAGLGGDLASSGDVTAQMTWRQIQALIHAHRGEHAEAERLAREAVEIGERTDALYWQGGALSDLAEVLETAGRPAEAAEALEQALDRYQRKQNLAMVAQVRPRLEALRAGTPA